MTELRHRIRGLEEGPLRALFDHETEHGNRIPVLEILHARLEGTSRGRRAVEGRSVESSRGDPDGCRLSGVGGDRRRAQLTDPRP